MCVNTMHSPVFAQAGATPLMLAAFNGHVEVMRMLLNEFGSSLDEVTIVSMYTPTCIKYTTYGETCISRL